MNETQSQQEGAASSSSPTGEEAQVGYAAVLRQQFAENPQFKSPAELAAKFHEVLLGRGRPTLSSQQQQARFHALADVAEVRTFTKAAGAELSRTYLVLDGLALRFAAQIARVDLGAGQGQMAIRDLERVGKLLELVVKCQREGRLCLSASLLVAHDLRALNMGEVPVGGGSHSSE